MDNNVSSPIVQFSQSSSSTSTTANDPKNASSSLLMQQNKSSSLITSNNNNNNAKTLQPKKSSSSPLSKIKFHSISKRRMSGGQSQKQLNMNEKFQLIRKHGTSSSSFIGSDEYDYINYGGTNASNAGNSSSGKSSLKKYFLKFAGDKVDSNSLEARNLFHLKRHHYPAGNGGGGGASSSATKVSSDDNDFDILDF